MFRWPRFGGACVAALVTLGAAAGCQGRGVAGDGPLRAVVVYDRERLPDAERARELLAGAGFDVSLQVSGVPYEHSAASVYDVARHPERTARVKDLLAPLGELEIKPFPFAGAGGNAVVVWLVVE